MTLPTVWVVHPVQLDLRALDNWGCIRYIRNELPIERNFTFPDAIIGGGLPDDVMQPLIDAAVEYDDNRDYLALVGDHLQLMQFSVLLAERRKKIWALRWDRETGSYYSVKMQFASTIYPLRRRQERATIVPTI